MISIRNSVNDLQKYHDALDLAVDSYQLAIRTVAQYSVDLEPEVTEKHRKYLESLAAGLSPATPESLRESNATFRALLRDYRDKGAQYLLTLREELSGTAAALQDILQSFAQSDGDHDSTLRSALKRIRSIPANAGAQIREVVLSTAKTIETSLDELRDQHKLTVAQFQMEIRMLHKRIDVLESAALVDSLTQLSNREQIEIRIREEHAGQLCLLLLKAGGIRQAATQYNREVSGELAGAFAARLRNCLPPNASIGRWSEEEFVAILVMEKPEAQALVKKIAEHLAGPYSCLTSGKSVRPMLHLRLAVIGYGSEPGSKVLQRVGEFLDGA